MNRINLYLLAITLTLQTINAHAALYDRGNGMIYDSEQNITWLQDGNYAATSNYPAAGWFVDYGEGDTYYYPGAMQWSTANTWANNLVYKGISGWRLPSAKLIGNTTFSYDGSTDLGTNNTRGEMGHLYYELGGTAIYVPGGLASGWHAIPWTFVDAATNNTVGFLNMMDAYTWWAAEIAWEGQPWSFDQIGLQTWSFGDDYNYAMVVHDGDIAGLATVPVPAAAWLFGSGLLGLVGAAKRRES